MLLGNWFNLEWVFEKQLPGLDLLVSLLWVYGGKGHKQEKWHNSHIVHDNDTEGKIF